ncbi:MAG: TetR/AcrR family transcriptional regulator [Sandaracinaceae bacterium]
MAKWKWTEDYLKSLYPQFQVDDGEDTSKARKRARIIKAATELFVRHGYRKVSVDEIARRAEVAKGTVYLYFPNKGALLLHAIAEEKKVLWERFAPLWDPHVDGVERLRFYLMSVFTIADELPLVSRLLSQDAEFLHALDDIDPEVVREGEEIGIQWFMDLLEAAAPDELHKEEKRARGEVMLALRWFIGILQDERVRHGRPMKEFAQTFTDVMMYGLMAAPPPPDLADQADDDEADEPEPA